MKTVVQISFFLVCILFSFNAKAQISIDLAGHYGISSMHKNSQERYSNRFGAEYNFNPGTQYGFSVGVNVPIVRLFSLNVNTGFNRENLLYSETLEFDGLGHVYFHNDFKAVSNNLFLDIGFQITFLEAKNHSLKAKASVGTAYILNSGLYVSQIRRTFLIGEEIASLKSVDEENPYKNLMRIIPKIGSLYTYKLSEQIELMGLLEFAYDFMEPSIYPIPNIERHLFLANIHAGIRYNILPKKQVNDNGIQ